MEHRGKGGKGKGKGGKGGKDFRPGKRRDFRQGMEETNERRIRSYILANSGSESDINELEEVLKQDIGLHTNLVLETLLECGCEMPLKTGIYATVVGLLNLEHHQFVADFVAAALARYTDHLSKPETHREQARLALRFIASLVGVGAVQAGSLVALLASIVQVATDLAEEATAAEGCDPPVPNESWQPYAECLIYHVLACLPWVGADLRERDPEGLELVLTSAEVFLGQRKRGTRSIFRSVGVAQQEDGSAAGMDDDDEDFIEELWGRISVLHEGGNWNVQSVTKYHSPFEHRLAKAISHDLPAITLAPPPRPPAGASPAEALAMMTRMFPGRPRLRIVDHKKTEGDRAPIERFVIEEFIMDTLKLWEGLRQECVTQLTQLPLPRKWSYEHLLAETVFALMLTLPTPPARNVFYSMVLADLCRLKGPEGQPLLPMMANGLAATMGGLFRRMDLVDLESRGRIAEWLAFHLSNFSFSWPWDRWAHAATLPAIAPQRMFVEDVLQRMMRLSYWDRIALTVPVPLHPLMTPRPEPLYEYSTEGANADEREHAKQLLQHIKDKKQVKVIGEWVKSTLIEQLGPVAAAKVVAGVVLHLSSKSFTHLSTLLDRLGPLISIAAPSSLSETQGVLLSTAAKAWATSPQHLAITIERMMAKRLVQNTVIVDWVFATWEEAGGQAERSLTARLALWEILYSTVNKTSARSRDLKQDLEAAETASTAAAEGLRKASAQAATAVEDHLAAAEEARAAAESAKAETNVETRREAAAQAQSDLEALLRHVLQRFSQALSTGLAKALEDGAEMQEADAEDSGAE
ncbi:Nucleic acid dioxygenase ALKBH1, partial [Cymbomonas tetramitiformis]